MRPQNPEELHELFTNALSSGNLDALIDLYEPGATLVPQPGGPPVTGHHAIREALQGFLALKPKVTIDTKSVTQTEGIALLRSNWTLKGVGPDGKGVEMMHRGAEIVRRQTDGTWRLVIDHPFGAD